MNRSGVSATIGSSKKMLNAKNGSFVELKLSEFALVKGREEHSQFAEVTIDSNGQKLRFRFNTTDMYEDARRQFAGTKRLPKYYSFEFRADRSLYFVGPEEERNGALQCKLIE